MEKKKDPKLNPYYILNKNVDLKEIRDKVYEKHNNKLSRFKEKQNLHSSGGPLMGSSSQMIIQNYGCEKCTLKNYCEYYPHKNKICAVRAKMYAEYLKAMKGDLIPIMKDVFMGMNMERSFEEARWKSKGEPPTKEWLKLNDQITKLGEAIHKCEQGIKVKHEVSYFDELCNEVYTKMKQPGPIEVVITET